MRHREPLADDGVLRPALDVPGQSEGGIRQRKFKDCLGGAIRADLRPRFSNKPRYGAGVLTNIAVFFIAEQEERRAGDRIEP
jgi:hypothetical protein